MAGDLVLIDTSSSPSSSSPSSSSLGFLTFGFLGWFRKCWLNSCRAWDSKLRVFVLRFRINFQDSGVLGLNVFGLRVSVQGFEVSGFRFRVDDS